ncbi:alpha/beta hydrolase family protein [Nocardia paucivorans]|mgnify:CR=1 FL=1|uniref:alpha/beta hydrolase family protein n=1 Tax=Nocardia paucivorans TaxID=114259 RepID=UPI0002DBC13C|nr:CocE/NonD family hydrolase [Nocardia paucivorans]
MFTRFVCALVCTGALAVLGVATSPPADGFPGAVATPVTAPNGPYPVGRTDTALTDSERTIAISVWYPAAASGSPAPYIPGPWPVATAQIAARTAQWLNTPIAAATMPLAAAPATADAAPAELGALPVVIWSPGLGTPRWLASGLAADIASRGYAVVTIDHTGEAPAVALPDGRLVLGEMPTGNLDYLRAALDARVADTLLVLDRLTTLPVIGDRIDPNRVAAAGHSYGGQTAVAAAAADPRIRTVLVLDGSAGWDGVVEVPHLARPVLLLAAGDMLHASWLELDTAVVGTIAGGGHYTPTDLPAFGGGIELCGTIPEDTGTEITRSVVAAWLDRTLRDSATRPLPEFPALHWRH